MLALQINPKSGEAVAIKPSYHVLSLHIFSLRLQRWGMLNIAVWYWESGSETTGEEHGSKLVWMASTLSSRALEYHFSCSKLYQMRFSLFVTELLGVDGSEHPDRDSSDYEFKGLQKCWWRGESRTLLQFIFINLTVFHCPRDKYEGISLFLLNHH